MADPELIERLKSGVQKWNRWRREECDVAPDLKPAKVESVPHVDFDIFRNGKFEKAAAEAVRRASVSKRLDLTGTDLGGLDLKEAELSRVDLSSANLNATTLSDANLRNSDLSSAVLNQVNFRNADLHKAILNRVSMLAADLRGADLSRTSITFARLPGSKLDGAILHEARFDGAEVGDASLVGAELVHAYLVGADFNGANLDDADLSLADLTWTNFTGAKFARVNMDRAIVKETVFANVDLSTARLERCKHVGPSTVDRRTLVRSTTISHRFLRGCGLQQWEIALTELHRKDLSIERIREILNSAGPLRAEAPLFVGGLFLSYSTDDDEFAEGIQRQFDRKQIALWRFTRNSAAGPIVSDVARSIRENPTVLLVLSSSSVQSKWVRLEVEIAAQLETELRRPVICPIALEPYEPLLVQSGWSTDIQTKVMEKGILDFSAWKDTAMFRDQFERLIKGLTLSYSKGTREST